MTLHTVKCCLTFSSTYIVLVSEKTTKFVYKVCY